jgi:hypothetical protein
MSDLHYNPLDPKLDLSCPMLDALISQSFDEGWQERPTEAMAELQKLREVIKALREQLERSEKALGEVSAERMKSVDKLCDIRDKLVSGYKSNPWAYIRLLCKKHFSLDVTTSPL